LEVGVVKRSRPATAGVGPDVVNQLVVDREVVPVPPEVETTDQEAAEPVPGGELALRGEHTPEGLVLLIREIGLQRQGPLTGAGEVLGPVDGEIVARGALPLQIDPVVQREIVEQPGAGLASKAGERYPGAGAIGVVEFSGQRVEALIGDREPDTLAVEAIVLPDVLDCSGAGATQPGRAGIFVLTAVAPVEGKARNIDVGRIGRRIADG
jgi:hypothetical protein